MEEKKVLNEEKRGNGITELVFILDKSGSMGGMEDDTVKGFNSMIAEQKEGEGTVLVSTVLFSNRSAFLHDRVDISNVEPLTERDYRVGGSTALMDAIGDAIKHIKSIHKYIRSEDVPERTMFIITTDGAENSSRKYSAGDVKGMIKECEADGWEFLFVADNIDAVETAASIGIREDRAAQYRVQSATPMMFKEMSETLSCYRETGFVREDWSKKINDKK